MNKKGIIPIATIIIIAILAIVALLAGSLFVYVATLSIPKLIGSAIIILTLLGASGLFGIAIPKKMIPYFLGTGIILFILPYVFTGLNIPLSAVM